jgi:hypothetical protein
MAIKTFKEIIENKGYRISSKDREIFEQGTLQSFFGFSNADMIEFIIYDANDNQLPQGEFGELVRYIPLNSENIKDYFLIADGTEFQAFQFPSEYFIDVERLIKESGYDNGIFKTQITLLNKRVGYESSNEKLWISEISPSRTEVRLLPIVNEVSKKTDLLQRFNIMVNGNDFRDDIIPYIASFIESINPSEVSLFIKKTYGERWYNNFVSEFGISGFDIMVNNIYKDFSKSVLYEFANRNSSIRDVNYGKKKQTKPSLQYAKEDVYKVSQRILLEAIEKYLPKRTVQTSTEVENQFDASVDELTKILQRRESDVVINPKIPQVNVTKEKKENVVEKVNLNKEIQKEVPAELPVPKFSTPNATKSTKKSVLKSRGRRGFGFFERGLNTL